MAELAHDVMRLLLFSFISEGINRVDGLIFDGKGYDVTFPCEEDFVCFHILPFSTSETSDYIAIVSNGKLRIAESESKDSKCSLRVTDPAQEVVGHRRCQRRPDVFSPHNTPPAIPDLNLTPGKAVSLQCVLLIYVELGLCSTQFQQVSLMWVDEAGAEIQEDSQHQIKQESPCDITLTVTFQSPQNKKFMCQVTVDGQVQTSVELWVRLPALKGRGRGLVIELEPENQGGKQDVIGAAVGVVGCVVLTSLVAAFVVKRRRTSNQLPVESCYTTNNNDTNPDDVIYAEVILPSGPDHGWVHVCNSTEYACIQYK